MNKIILFVLLTASNFLSSQSLEIKELWRINKKYDSILVGYQNKAKDSLSDLSKKEKKKIMVENENRIANEKRKFELDLLEKIKAIDEKSKLSFVSSKTLKCENINKEVNEFNKLNKNKYIATDENQGIKLKNKNEQLSTILTFIVSEKGYISNVKATGANQEFNRENELILYKLGRFKPQCVDGFTQTARFRMPVTMKFDK